MSLNPVHTVAPKVEKTTMPGIHAHGDKARMIDVLNRLGLCPTELSTNLKKLAAHGQPTKDIFQVSVHDLDLALQNVECSTSQRMQFKSSLEKAGLLKYEYLSKNPHTGKAISKPVG